MCALTQSRQVRVRRYPPTYHTRSTALASAILTLALLYGASSQAHERWRDGSAVSEEVKRLCCGEADAHFLPPGSVHADRNGWRIDGFQKVVPYGKELPSSDGEDWGFWPDHPYSSPELAGGQTEIYCLFLRPRAL
jgi:hypothetical protein